MKQFHFSKIYFNKTLFNDEKSRIRVVVKELPSLEITEEEYSLRVETRHEEGRTIHRNYAIEHHDQPKHSYPHLQFKFHTEEIGTFRIRLDFKDSEEYKRAIFGFIYKIKNVLQDLEKHRKGITKEILILEEVNKLQKDEIFLNQKMRESLNKYIIKFDTMINRKSSRLKENPLLLGFLGKHNINRIIKTIQNS